MVFSAYNRRQQIPPQDYRINGIQLPCTLIVHSLSISWQLPSGGIFVQGVWLVRIHTFNSAITPFTLI